ncbi:unnamed protein product, partial [Rotaria socialis]
TLYSDDKINNIDINTSFFSLGGNSLMLMKLHFEYGIKFNINSGSLVISELFRSPTIAEHAQFVEQSAKMKCSVDLWQPLYLNSAIASYAQEAVWLAERCFFPSTSLAIYNMFSIYRVSKGQLSIRIFLDATNAVVARHSLLRTQLFFDCDEGRLYQCILDPKVNSNLYSLEMSVTEKNIEEFIHWEEKTPIENDRIFRCHFIRVGHNDDGIMKPGDALILNFHHGSIDGRSMDLFMDELKFAYENLDKYVQQTLSDDHSLQYIDYAVHERVIKQDILFWLDNLKGYGWDRRLRLPYDVNFPKTGRRTGLGSAKITLVPESIAHAMFAYAKEHETTLYQLSLTCVYVFLVLLSPENLDACIGIVNHNRYRPELKKMLGMFVNILPCRISFADDIWDHSFEDILSEVRRKFIDVVEHSSIPYAEILKYHRVPNMYQQHPFLNMLFMIESSHDYNNVKEFNLSMDCQLKGEAHGSINVAKFDLILELDYDIETFEISLSWQYATDLFNPKTIDELDQLFHHLLAQLFESTANPFQRHLGTLEKFVIESTPLEKRLRVIFARALGIDNEIDIDMYNSFFFNCGATSLNAMQVIALIQRDICSTFTVEHFFSNLTVKRCASIIEQLLMEFAVID